MDRLYLLILILIVIFSLNNLKYFITLPAKLRIISLFLSFTIFSKVVSHMILFYSNSLNYIFILKPFISLGLIYIPLISFSTIVILAKKNRIKSKTYILISALSILLYAVTFRFNYNIVLEKGYIYSIRYSNPLYYQIYFYMAVIIFVIGLDYISKINKKKLHYLFLLSSFLSIIDSIFYMYNIVFMPENLLGDVSFIILFNIVLRKNP